MVPSLRNRKADTLAGVGIALRAVRDSTDAFPPLKSVVAVAIIVWEMSKVRFLFRSLCDHPDITSNNHLESKVKQEGL